MVGQIISHYKIIEKIGSGGMGIVYKAQDLKLDRTVALKFLPVHMGEDNTQKQRFIHEAKAASALDHPNICTIYEIDETEPVAGEQPFGQIFIAMACYDGQTLQDKIESDAPMPVDESISIILQLAQGLQKAHEKEIVHRDIKPANIMLLNSGIVKITDFGIARITAISQTQTGIVKGTPYYMSPEQFSGQKVDGRSDIFSLGTMFFQLLTGELPFTGENPAALMNNIMNVSHPNPKSINPKIVTPIVTIINMALEKDRKNRYQRASQMSAHLKEVRKKIDAAIAKNKKK